MDHTRDVVWSASPAFIWDAARINLPDGKTSLAMSVYPPESAGPGAWSRSTEYTKDTIERFSKHWYPYPWPAAGQHRRLLQRHGISRSRLRRHRPTKANSSSGFTAHEFGHTWFPMIVGSNERRNAFMDEGFNTFIDIEESAEFAGGKYGPKRDSEYSAGGEPPDTILKVLDNPDRAPSCARRRLPMAARPSGQLLQRRLRHGPAPRADPRPRSLRLGLPQVHPRLGLQAPVPIRLLPRNGKRRR
jgi:hypothetical protein